MKRGFYTIMAAQFFSSLADNALLIAAMALLISMQAPGWMTPLLKLFFALSYVLLAAYVGAFADALPKGKVMFITNLIKVGGCALMFFHVHPLIAYALVGFGAAAYSPAKYGILTELLPAEKLVAANGWIEGLTVTSIILGTVLGGSLIDPRVSAALLNFDFPIIDFSINTPTEAALCVITALYVLAALFNLRIPDTGARYEHQKPNPIKLIADFGHCFSTLWRDKLGQISLAVTTLFWGAGATLQFIVLKWGRRIAGLTIEQSGSAARCSCDRNCNRRSGSGALRSAEKIPECDAAGCSDGPGRHHHDLRSQHHHCLPTIDTGWCAGRFFCGTDECLVAASRSCADECRSLDRRPEFQ